MKKLKTTVIILACVFALTGCVRMNVGMNIDSSGNTDVSILYAVMDTGEGLDGSIPSFENEGWTVEEYSQDGYIGVIASRKGLNLDDAMSEINDSEFSGLSITKNGKNYVLDWQIIDDADMAELAEYIQYFGEYGGYMTFELTLPYEAIESNATSVSEDGLTLTWDLTRERNIHAEFSLGRSLPIIPIVIAAAAVLLIVAIVLIIVAVSRNSKKKKASMAYQNMYGQPGYPQPPYGQPGYPGQPYGQQYNPQYNPQAPAQPYGQQYNPQYNPQAPAQQPNGQLYNPMYDTQTPAQPDLNDQPPVYDPNNPQS